MGIGYGIYATRVKNTPKSTINYFKQGTADFEIENSGYVNRTQRTTSFTSRPLTDDELIETADHVYGSYRELYNSKFDTGHEFFTVKQDISFSHENELFSGSGHPPYYVRGCIQPLGTFGTYQYPDIPRLTDSEIAFYGHKAIAVTQPTRPDANIGDFVSQTILTPRPKLPFSDLVLYFHDITYFLKSLAKGGSEQWLNLEFGWAPMIGDLKGIMNDVLNSYKLIKDYEKGSGKVTRRGFHFDHISSYTDEGTSVGTAWLPMFPAYAWAMEKNGNEYGDITINSSLDQDIWFNGAFTYYLGDTKTLLGKFERYAQLAQHILGFKLTPDALWDLAPWTWLVDWKFDITSMLETNTALGDDSLVIRYGYLMRRSVATRNYILTGLQPYVGKPGPYVASLVVVQKERVRATPFGFGINPEDFSLQQLSILASLGISRALRDL
jgi:hypothetical protein